MFILIRTYITTYGSILYDSRMFSIRTGDASLPYSFWTVSVSHSWLLCCGSKKDSHLAYTYSTDMKVTGSRKHYRLQTVRWTFNGAVKSFAIQAQGVFLRVHTVFLENEMLQELWKEYLVSSDKLVYLTLVFPRNSATQLFYHGTLNEGVGSVQSTSSIR